MKLAYAFSVFVTLVAFLFCRANGNMIASVHYTDGPRIVDGMFFARGSCVYEFDTFYPISDVKVNITFAREIAEFDDFDVWVRVDSSPGVYYFSESKFIYNPTQQVPIDFNIKWALSQGPTTPDAECETNVGFVVTTTTAAPPPDEAEAVETAIQALLDDVELLTPAYRRAFRSWP